MTRRRSVDTDAPTSGPCQVTFEPVFQHHFHIHRSGGGPRAALSPVFDKQALEAPVSRSTLSSLSTLESFSHAPFWVCSSLYSLVSRLTLSPPPWLYFGRHQARSCSASRRPAAAAPCCSWMRSTSSARRHEEATRHRHCLKCSTQSRSGAPCHMGAVWLKRRVDGPWAHHR